jgi:FkbM family methyltransferase
MTDRVIPKAKRPLPNGHYEAFLAWGQSRDNTFGYACNRKLKRRYRKRPDDSFDQVLADTHAGDLCIDLGANIGSITTRLAATGADVISFEPDPQTFAVLEQNTAHLPNVTRYQKAAGAQADQLMLRRAALWDANDPMRHSEASSIARADKGMADTNSVLVDVVDFKEFIEMLDRDVRILKIDIEGAEWDLLDVLLDAPVLRRIDSIFVETHERFEPQINIARFNRLAERAFAMDRPYINLYWQ